MDNYQTSNVNLAQLQSRLTALKTSSPQQRTKTNESNRVTFHWLDFSFTFILLVLCVSFGFQAFFTFNQPSTGQVAGIKDYSTNIEKYIQDQAPSELISQEDYDIWLDNHYKLTTEETTTSNDQPMEKKNTLTEVFGTSDIKKINELKLDSQQLNNEIKLIQTRNEYVELANKIDSLISMYRSYEPYDSQLEVPLKGITYIAVSEQTGIPLKYLLTLSRLESRFGTDRFTQSGNLTRPGKHNNPCSIGLDDSGGNITFSSWEEGLNACGKWYAYFEAKNVPNCRKWRIFNPNGDYCSKVETVSSEIQKYLES